MKLIMIASPGKLDCYLEDFTASIAATGVETRFQSLSALNGNRFPVFWRSPERKRHDALRKLVEKEKPDVLVFNSSKPRFDFREIREFFHGRIIVYDMEGPNFPAFARAEQWIHQVNLVVTTSRFSCRELRKKGYSNAVYLPHGVNPHRFYPEKEVDPVFLRERIFIGRPSPHRIQCFETLLNADLPVTLYGKKWHELSDLSPGQNAALFPLAKNIYGENLRRAVSGAGLFINVQQDQFKDLHTLVNMQVFIVPARRPSPPTDPVDEPEAPLDPSVEFDRLAEHAELTGSGIKAAAVSAAYAAAAGEGSITLPLLRQAAAEELRKSGRLVEDYELM